MIVALCSWALTLAFVASYLRAHRRLVNVARACHELRGPLFAVQLGLTGLAGEPSRLAAIELELARAGRALEDLTAAPSGARVVSRREIVDVFELVESYAPAWETLAAGYGAALRVEPRPPESTDAPSPAGAPPRPLAAAIVAPPLGAEPPVAATSSPFAPPVAAGPPLAAPGVAAPSRSRAPAVPASPHSPARAIASLPQSSAPPVAPPRGAFARFFSTHGRAQPAAPTLAAPSSTTIVADPLRIAQACANLIGNAAEHGGGIVRVRVRAAGGSVRIEVADDGPGLSRNVSALTAAARTRRGRRGHGLAIAAAIAEHHGGRLTSAPAEAGARLVLELPGEVA